MANISSGQAQQASAQAEIQKNEAKMQTETQLEKTKNDLKIQFLQQEVQSKKELMQFEFELNKQLEGMKLQTDGDKEEKRENRKDLRVDRQAKHQMNMIEQRKQGDVDKKFESSGNDILTGGANMEKFSV